ncbi:MAG TPA: helix-turn-helix domain-containing protein [Nostocaceae cyanobacterium]|nr:helix-turn-helix domain-containing protein [Nostocaceae cyanobacterium]
MREGSKYQPLLEFLRGCQQNDVILSFAEIETLINHTLPDSAKINRAWWSNRKKGALQATAWMQAGYRVEDVDFAQQQVRFVKPPDKFKVQRERNTVVWKAELIKALRLHLGLNQTEFGDLIGVRQGTVSDWEIGHRTPSLPTSKLLEIVAERSGFRYENEEESKNL